MSTSHDCCLCSQIAGWKENDLIARLLPPDQPYARRIIFESASFAVVPSLGPLVRGHMLLCPKAHVRSFAQVYDNLHTEYEEVKARLSAVLREKYAAEITLFEHGMAATGDRILCTVDHAHMHFVPLPPAFDAGPANRLEWMKFDGSLSSLCMLSRGHEYVFYGAPDGVCRLLKFGVNIKF